MDTLPDVTDFYLKVLLWGFIWWNVYDHCTGRWRLFWPWFGVLFYTSIQPI